MSTRHPLAAPRWIVVLAGLALAAASLAAAPTYRWVDEKGQVHYGDAIPAQQSGMGHTELDKQGRVLKQAPRTRLTAEEQRRQREEALAREQRKRAQELRERQDRALLSTYTSEREIDLTRDRALELERLSLEGIRLRLDRSKTRLAHVNADIAQALREGRRVTPAYLASMRAEAENEVIALSSQILARTQAMNEIRARYDADKARWRELKGLHP